MDVENGILDLHPDTENELLKSDSETGDSTTISKPVMAIAKSEMMSLLKEIRDTMVN